MSENGEYVVLSEEAVAFATPVVIIFIFKAVTGSYFISCWYFCSCGKNYYEDKNLSKFRI